MKMVLMACDRMFSNSGLLFPSAEEFCDELGRAIPDVDKEYAGILSYNALMRKLEKCGCKTSPEFMTELAKHQISHMKTVNGELPHTANQLISPN